MTKEDMSAEDFAYAVKRWPAKVNGKQVIGDRVKIRGDKRETTYYLEDGTQQTVKG